MTTEAAPTLDVQLPSEIFDAPINVALIHQVVVGQLAAARHGTHDTKTRGETRGGGRKPYRQKGTGRARQGSTRAPQFTGGGTVFGPTPRSYEQRTPKKMKAAALRGALSDRARGGRVHVVTRLVDTDRPSTKTAIGALLRVTEREHVLVVAERADQLTWKSLRNIPTVHLIAPDQLNAYDVLVSDDVVFTQEAFTAFVNRSGGSESEATAVSEKPATPAGKTEPAGADLTDEQAVEEVAEQTSPDLKAEQAFEKAADEQTDVEAADAPALQEEMPE